MAAMAFVSALLALIVAVWLILRNLDDALNKVFGRKPQPGPHRRHRAF